MRCRLPSRRRCAPSSIVSDLLIVRRALCMRHCWMKASGCAIGARCIGCCTRMRPRANGALSVATQSIPGPSCSPRRPAKSGHGTSPSCAERFVQRVGHQLPPRRATQNEFKKATISRAEGGQLEPPIRHAIRRYVRHCSAQRILRYNGPTPEFRPEHGLVRLRPCCNLVPGQQRCRYWWRVELAAHDPDEQAGYPHDWAGAYWWP
jgi:hypothetical protein